MGDDKKKPEKIHISRKTAKKLAQSAGKLPEGKAGDSMLKSIIKALKG
jgi:hypothetical protein